MIVATEKEWWNLPLRLFQKPYAGVIEATQLKGRNKLPNQASLLPEKKACSVTGAKFQKSFILALNLLAVLVEMYFMCLKQ